MNKTISVYIAVALMLATAALVAIGQRATNPDRVNAVAHRIADFDLPIGYETDYVVEVLDYTIASYKSADEQSHIAFLQAPTGVIPDETMMAGYIPNARHEENWQAAMLISANQITVRGQSATLTVSERLNGEGILYRNANLVFQGREGTVLLVINQPASIWDDDVVDRFIASIN